jgi:hypothetical protein
MSKVGAFEVFNKMVEMNDGAIKLAPLDNIVHLKKVRAGTEVTIGVQGDVVGPIFNGRFVGGLILCDKVRYEEVKAEMEKI